MVGTSILLLLPVLKLDAVRLTLTHYSICDMVAVVIGLNFPIYPAPMTKSGAKAARTAAPEPAGKVFER